MSVAVDLPTPVDVLLDPVVQLAALCPLCALAALKPEAALAALSPSLAVFNPALNPRAALLAFSLSQSAARLATGVAAVRQRAGLARAQLIARVHAPLT